MNSLNTKQSSNASKDLAISGAGIEKSFRSGTTHLQVLRSIDLQVRRGECIFLAGPSGSGKSTLLSILGCILTPDAGSVRLLEQDLSTMTKTQRAQFRREQIGFVFQRFHLFRGLNAWENVCVPFNLMGQTGRQAKRRACELLEAVGLGDKLSSPIAHLSIGQRQRVALARALAGDPDLILADEPTASLDGQSGMVAMELLKRLAKEHGKTCVVVTHDSRIFPLADRILHLQDGRILREEQPVEGAPPVASA